MVSEAGGQVPCDGLAHNLCSLLAWLRTIPLGLTGSDQRAQFDPWKPWSFLSDYLPALPGLLITAIASLFGAQVG